MRALNVAVAVALSMSAWRPVPARADAGEAPAWRDPDLPPLGGASTAESGEGDSTAPRRAYARNALFLEFGGSGLLYSLNYERFVSEAFALRVGLEEAIVAFVVPMTASFFVRRGNHALELGGGIVSFRDRWSDDDATDQFFVGTAIIGYRYLPAGGGSMLRIAFTPFLGSEADRLGVRGWFGLAIGAAF